ncbi:MAG: metal-dependent transcriptional regulator [Lachnospiraceae bacterium]|nr:metal-dependent transcriptional regulator [Lachnospiraceae bacterium]
MNESAEDYIKTIYILKDRIECVRSIDVAHELGFSRASVSTAMANLKNKGIISMQRSGEIDFTESGKVVAQEIYERHATLSELLQTIAGVDERTAKEDACKIEHFLSKSTLDGIKRYICNKQK